MSTDDNATLEAKEKERHEKAVLTTYITNRLRGLVKVDKDITLAMVVKVVMPLLQDKTKHDFMRLYEEAQLIYLAELDEGKRLSNLEYALKEAEGTLKKLGCKSLITMDEEADG